MAVPATLGFAEVTELPPQQTPSQAPVLSLVRLTVRAALTLPPSQLAEEAAKAKGARWLLAAGMVLAETLAAVAVLGRAGVTPDQLVVHSRHVLAQELQQLWQAGVRKLAWSVQAISAVHPSFAPLAQAMRAAKKLGFFVQLRWTVTIDSAPALARLGEPAIAALSCDEILLQPELEVGRTPSALQLHECWPAQPTQLPRLLLSELWPQCLALPCDAVEPIAHSEAAEVAQRPACQGCPSAHRCPGIALSVVAACDASGTPWRGMTQGLPAGDDFDDPSAEADGASASGLRFASESVEMRGLAMGLRDAWRLRVASADVKPFAAAARRAGWHVAWSEQSFVGHAGGRMTQAAAPEAEAAHVVVVARTDELAGHCIADELALLRPDHQRTAAAVAAMVEAHRRLGAAYGFPACCVEAFCDAFGEVVFTDRIGDNAVAVLRAALRSEFFDPRCFTLVAGLGQQSASPLRHLPCRFDCQASRELAIQLQPQPPAPWPVVVWADGSFAVIYGSWAGTGRVTDVRSCEVFGFDPSDAGASKDRSAFAEPLTWSALAVEAGRLTFDPEPGLAEVAGSSLPSSDMFPLLLPFGASADLYREA